MTSRHSAFPTAIGAIASILVSGCYEHKVDTVPKWCEQISGVDFEAKYSPFWAVIFSTSFDAEAIRDDYARNLNEIYVQKTENRTDQMAWREGASLHLVNFSTYFTVDPNEFIDEWRRGIALGWESNSRDKGEVCLFGTLTSMFDDVRVHTITPSAIGVLPDDPDEVTILSTEREKRLGKKRL